MKARVKKANQKKKIQNTIQNRSVEFRAVMCLPFSVQKSFSKNWGKGPD